MQEPEIDLLLIGHAVEDWIFDGTNEPYQKWGGIYNTNRSWKNIASNHGVYASKVHLEPSSYGHAFIKINRQNGTKDVSASLNDKERDYCPRPSRWTHYSYVNEMDNLYIDSINGGILSADACAGKILTRSAYFKYIFLSSDEHDPYQESSCSFSDSTIFVAHCPSKVELWNNGKLLWESKPIEKLENINCLGVGDNFAAAFIFAKLYLHNHDEAAATFAIQNCREYLLSN